MTKEQRWKEVGTEEKGVEPRESKGHERNLLFLSSLRGEGENIRGNHSKANREGELIAEETKDRRHLSKVCTTQEKTGGQM